MTRFRGPSANPLVVGLLALLLGALFGPHDGDADHRHNRCGFHWRKGRTEIVRLIRCEAERQGVDPDVAVATGSCESGLRPRAVSESGRYRGIYQQDVATWRERARRYGFRGWSVFNARANAMVSIRMMRDAGEPPNGLWPNCP